MGKIKLKKIGTFAEFCKAKQKQLIKESNEVAIDVPFYNDAVESIISEIQMIAGDPIEWRTLVDYIKMKYLVIDREVTGGDDCLVIAHIRDLLFQHYGDTFLGGDYGCFTGSTAEMGAKSLVLSQLASDILRKVRINAGLETPEPEQEDKPITTVSLDFDNWEDNYFGENRNIRKVAGFSDFSSLLKESVDKLTVKYDKKALEYCLDKLKKKAGSLKYEDVLKVVKKEETTFSGYLTGLAEEYMESVKIELNGKELQNEGNDKLIFNQAKHLFAHEIAKELTEKIKKETL